VSVSFIQSWYGTSLNKHSLKVNCYSGHTYAERPRSFLWQGIEYKVKEIEKAWQELGKRLFKVTTDEGKSFELCYNEADDQWSLLNW
jgi:hypothetical protein